MMRSALVALAVLVLAATGCSRSPRPTFYTLMPVQTAAEAPAADTAAPSVAVGPVSLPEMVDRPQLVVREGANRVEVLEMQRWAEPLKTSIPNYLARELGVRLGSSRVASYQQFSGRGADYRMLVDILRFESLPEDSVTVEANWVLRRSGLGASRTGHCLVREKILGAGYEAVVAAYGRALSGVADELAKGVRAEFAARPVAAPVTDEAAPGAAISR